MALGADRYAYEQQLREFESIVQGAQRTIAAQVRAAIASGDIRTASRRRLQLAAVQATLEQLGMAVDPFAARLVAQAYQQGAEKARQQLIGAHITAPEIPGAFAGVSREALQALQDSVVQALQASRATVGRTVNDVYGRAGRRAAIRAVLGADGSPRKAQRDLMNQLMQDRDIARAVDQGGFGFVDKAGKRWALDTYAQMVVRTTTREAVVQGAMARMASHQINLARVSVHASSCKICMPWEGRLVSLDGTTTDYQGEAVTDLSSLPSGGPPFHPNCRHSLAPVAVGLDAIRREMQTIGGST